jgi:hypothetical protein
MSERFLEGFVISPAALSARIGTPDVGAKAIRKKLGKKPIVKDMDMTLGDGDPKRGKALVDAALDALAHGAPFTDVSAYHLTRVTALVLHAYADPLGTIELVPFVEGDSFGLWNPALAALGLRTLAKEWCKAPFPFPFAKRTRATTVGWPLTTLVGASLMAWKKELASPWEKRLATMPDRPFIDKKYGTGPERIAETKEDLLRSLEDLRSWVDRAAKKKGNALVLVLDGDQ